MTCWRLGVILDRKSCASPSPAEKNCTCARLAMRCAAATSMPTFAAAPIGIAEDGCCALRRRRKGCAYLSGGVRPFLPSIRLHCPRQSPRPGRSGCARCCQRRRPIARQSPKLCASIGMRAGVSVGMSTCIRVGRVQSSHAPARADASARAGSKSVWCEPSGHTHTGAFGAHVPAHSLQVLRRGPGGGFGYSRAQDALVLRGRQAAQRRALVI